MAEIEIDTARAADLDGLLALQEANQPEHGGTLSARLPRAMLAAPGLTVLVARRDGAVVGFLVAAEITAVRHVPVIAAMLGAYPGGPDAYAYGPVCVAAEERGHGLAGRMFAALRARMPGREAILFIRSDNAASLRAHAKMGMRAVAGFRHEGVAMRVLAYRG